MTSLLRFLAEFLTYTAGMAVLLIAFGG